MLLVRDTVSLALSRDSSGCDAHVVTVTVAVTVVGCVTGTVAEEVVVGVGGLCVVVVGGLEGREVGRDEEELVWWRNKAQGNRYQAVTYGVTKQ